METTRNTVISFLKSLQKRVHRHAIFQEVTLTFFFATCLLAVLFVSIRLVHFPFHIALVTLLVIIGAVASGICLSFRNRKTLSDIAAFVDENQTLKERISTSLELIQGNQQGELVDLQIRDAAEGISEVNVAKMFPFVSPPLLKWISIPMLIIALSFIVPRQYELPQPPTIVEGEAIDKTIKDLSDEFENINNPIIREQISKTIKHLKNVKDVTSAQEHLRKLNSEVRKQKSELPDASAIEQATQATQHFRGMGTAALADELERLAAQDELTPELRAQLAKLFAKLKESIRQGDLKQKLDQIQGKTVTPDKLQEIANALHQANLLNQLEAQLIESRKDIALASIETEGPNGGFANSDGAPGQEAGNTETQGSLVSGDTSDYSPATDDATSPSDNNTTEKPIIGDRTASGQVADNVLTLNSEPATDAQTITKVFSGNIGTEETEPEYMQFSDVVLNAQRDYAQAIENNRIPVRYRSQIKAYLEAIAKINEK